MYHVIFIGAGGHCRVVMDALKRSDAGATVIGILDNNADLWQTTIAGIPVLGGDDRLSQLAAEGQGNAFVVAIGAYRGLSVRQKLYDHGVSAGLQALTVAHPSSICSPAAEIAAGCQLLAQSVVNPDAHLQENVIVNTAAIVEHDCRVGRHSQIGPRACLAGGVTIGTETHIGMGATVLENLSIGSRCVIGAGAVVTSDVPDDTVVVGVPARPIQRRNS